MQDVHPYANINCFVHELRADTAETPITEGIGWIPTDTTGCTKVNIHTVPRTSS